VRRRFLLTLIFLAVFVTALSWFRHRAGDDDASRSRAVSPGAAALDSSHKATVEKQDTQPAADRTSDRGAAATAQLITFGGVVLDYRDESSTGAPAAGVAVVHWQGFGGKYAEPVITDAQGRFHVQIADPGMRPLTFHFSCDGADQVRGDLAEVTVAKGSSENLAIVLRRYSKGDVTGITVDAESKPLADVLLTFYTATGADKEEMLQTASEADGRFRLPSVQWITRVEPEREGYMMLEASRPKLIPAGGWEPMRIVLGPIGRLRVIVLDENGDPVRGVSVSASVSKVERFGKKEFADSGALRPSASGETDASGVVHLDPVWADRRLSIQLEQRTESTKSLELASEFVRDDRLSFVESLGGAPIVVAKGEELALRAILPHRVKLTGRVEFESGEAVSHAGVGLETIDWSSREQYVRASTQCDADGKFTLEVVPAIPLHELRVTSSAQSAFIFGKEQKFATMDLDLDAGTPSDIVLVLRQSLSIRGRMIDVRGKAVHGIITAHPQGSGVNAHDSSRAMSVVDDAGTFELNGLPPGTYDILGSPNHGQIMGPPLEPFGETWVRGVAAGSQGVEIRITSESVAHVVFDMVIRDGEASDWIVLRARLYPRGDVAGIPSLAPAATYSAFKGWPSTVLGSWYGGGGEHEPRGLVSFLELQAKENPMTLTVEPGDYWLGVQGKDKHGNFVFPIGTGLVHVEPGDYRLQFELTTAAPVEGRVRADDLASLAVGIAHEGTGLLELDVGHRYLRRYRELGADGWFSFALVPVGEHDLWIGTPAELAAGNPSYRQTISIRREGTAPLEIVLTR
jgi:hypothetical protein